MQSKTYAALLLPWILGSCSLLGTDSAVGRRYKTLGFISDATPAVDVRLTAGSIPPTSRRVVPLVERLDDHGQAKLIEVLHDRVPGGAAQLFAELDKAGSSTTDGQPDRTLFRRRLLVSPRKLKAWGQADRIEELDLIFTLPTGAKFVSWDVAATTYGTIDLGKVSQTDGTTFNAAIEPTLSGSLAGVGQIGIESTSTRFEERNLSERYVEMAGILQEQTGQMRMESAVGRDLVGNTAVDVVIRLPSTKRRLARMKLSTPAGVPAAPAAVSYSFHDTALPVVPCNDVAVSLGGSYAFRSVACGEGDDTYLEGDDNAKLRLGKLPSALAVVVTVTEASAAARYFYVEYYAPDGWSALRVTDTGNPTPLWFATFEEAEAFRLWLQNQHDSANRNQIRIGQTAGEGELVVVDGAGTMAGITFDMVEILQVGQKP